MGSTPAKIAEFLDAKTIAVAGVSREPGQAANAIFRKLKSAGYTVFPVNPSAADVEGSRCYPDIASLPGTIDGVVVVTHPNAALTVVEQAADRGISRIWFHRSFGEGSVSGEAVEACRARGIEPIVGGCPMMFCKPVDVAHACFRWWLQWRGSVPK